VVGRGALVAEREQGGEAVGGDAGRAVGGGGAGLEMCLGARDPAEQLRLGLAAEALPPEWLLPSDPGA
jgi:hypothetical protein